MRRKSNDAQTVSVIIPTLNEELCVENMLNSAYAQTYRPLEIVLVDGGSSDRTLEIANKVAEKFSDDLFRICVFSEKKFGKARSPANARNIGVQASKGEYLILLDADTFFIQNDSVEKIKKVLEKYDFTGANSKIIVDTELERQIALTYPRICKCGYRRKVFDSVQFDPSLGYGEDHEFLYRLKEVLNVDLNIKCDTVLGRHLPHTFSEYINQAIWYAKTCPLYVMKVSK